MFCKSLLGVSLLTNISMLPLLRFQSSLKGKEKLSIRKLGVVKISSGFVSVNTNMTLNK